MFRQFVNFIRDLLFGPITKPQTASVEIVRNNLANSIEFHNETYQPPLTINALVHGGTLKQRDFMRNAINVMRHVVVSDMFQNAILDHGPFHGSTDNSLTIYKKFMSGKDLYEQFADYEMDVDVTLYYNKWTKTMGYTYPNTRRTWLNMSKFDIQEYEIMAKVVGNLVHEYLHNIGYTHTKYWTKNRKNSVNHAIGYMARDLALEFLASGRDIAKFSEVYIDSTN